VGCASLDLCLLWLRITQAPSWHPAVSPWGALVLVATPLLARRPSLAALAALAALGLRLAPTGRLTLTFLAVGQGDAALVRWPDGRSWLVDAGPEEREVLEWLRRAGLRSLDVVAATHPHPDHIGGLPAVLAEVPVAEFWVPRRAHPGEETFAALLDIASQRGVVVRDAGDPAVPALHPLPGWRSAPGDANEDSLALWLAYGQHRFLLAGDVEARAEAALVTRVGPVDLLKVPHHGSRTSSGAALLQALRPRLAVLSCGPGNTFGHPHPEVLARYAGTRLLRTDVDGTVEVVSDGLTLRVRTWRPGEGWRERGELDGYPWPSRASAAASALSWPSLESSRNR
jgi:competence protein ComEC